MSMSINVFFLILKMKSKTTCYAKNKEKLKEYAQNHYYLKNGETNSKGYYENNKARMQQQVQNYY